MGDHRRNVGAMLLTPGAGSGRDHHTLLAIEAGVAPLPCVRLDFPYRIAGRKAPDRAPVLVAHIVAAVEELCAQHDVAPEQVVLGGRSMGGRMCSMAVAEGLGAAGLLLISYPLHPPGKPDKLRTAHLPDIDVPCLFLSGTRDPFGSPEELAAATEVIAGPVTHHWIEGRRHDLDRCDPELVAHTTSWLAGLTG